MTRGRVAKTPYFPETISCLAWIPGESWDSGCGLGLEARANLAGFLVVSRRVTRAVWGRAARLENGADNRRFRPMGGPRRKTGWAGTGERGILSVSRRARAREKQTPGGHDLVNRKKMFQEREELHEAGTDLLRARPRWSSASSLKPSQCNRIHPDDRTRRL